MKRAKVHPMEQIFLFKSWGFLGAALWVGLSPTSFIAINHIGYAMGPAIWAGVTIVVSFIYGAAYFNVNKNLNVVLAVVALIVLVVGVCGIALSDSDIFS